MFCPKCNVNVTPIHGRCPECKRSMTASPTLPKGATPAPKAPSKAEGWQAPETPRPETPPPRPGNHLWLREEFASLVEGKEPAPAPAPPPPAPVKSRTGPRLVAAGFCVLVAVAAGGALGQRQPAPAPAVASVSGPVTSAVQIKQDTLERAQRALDNRDFAAAIQYYDEAEAAKNVSAERSQSIKAGRIKAKLAWADQLLIMASHALDENDFNGALGRAAQAAKLNRACSGPPAQLKKAQAITQAAHSKLLQAHAATTQATESAPPEAAPSAAPELPSLGDGSTVPVSSHRAHAAVPQRPTPGAAIIASRPAKPKPAAAPVVHRPAAQPEARLGDKNSVPGYNTASRYH